MPNKNNSSSQGQAEDKVIECVECNGDFVWSVRDQKFYESKQYPPPKRCPSCREARKRQRSS